MYDGAEPAARDQWSGLAALRRESNSIPARIPFHPDGGLRLQHSPPTLFIPLEH